MRALCLAFGLLMVAAAAVQANGPALAVAGVAGVAVLAGTALRGTALDRTTRWGTALVGRTLTTVAVVATAVALGVSDPSPAVAALAGVAATVHLVLWHARSDHPSASLTVPTVVGALGLSAAAVLGAAVPLALPWVPLVAPLAVVAIYVLALGQYVD